MGYNSLQVPGTEQLKSLKQLPLSHDITSQEIL